MHQNNSLWIYLLENALLIRLFCVCVILVEFPKPYVDFQGLIHLLVHLFKIKKKEEDSIRGEDKLICF